jgi:hypothetical protein
MKDWMVFVGFVMWLWLWLWWAEKRCPFVGWAGGFAHQKTPKWRSKKPPNPMKDWMVFCWVGYVVMVVVVAGRKALPTLPGLFFLMIVVININIP